MTEYVFLNDSLVESQQAHVGIHDAGLLHGVGLFETMRSYRGRVFGLAEHLDRLFNSAATLGIPVTQSPADLTEAIQSLLEANHLQDARLRLTVTGGNIKTPADQPAQNTLFITAAAIEPYPADFYRRGMTVIASPYKQNPQEPTAGHKTVNYLQRLLALRQAQSQHAGEALWFTPDNRLAEACISNVFIVQQDELLTPPLETGILPGIIRKFVLDVAAKNNIKSHERNIFIKDLLAASEIFLTNSIMELMPVCRLERHAVGKEKPGPIYKKLHELYRQAAQEDDSCHSREACPRPGSGSGNQPRT